MVRARASAREAKQAAVASRSLLTSGSTTRSRREKHKRLRLRTMFMSFIVQAYPALSYPIQLLYSQDCLRCIVVLCNPSELAHAVSCCVSRPPCPCIQSRHFAANLMVTSPPLARCSNKACKFRSRRQHAKAIELLIELRHAHARVARMPGRRPHNSVVLALAL